MKTRNLVAIAIIGLMLATAFSGCLGGKKPAGEELGAKPSGQEAGKGWLYGKVTDKTGGLISDATITIGGTQFATAADAEGKYIIKNIEPGTYNVTASAEGYKESTKPAEINADEGTELNFELESTAVPGKSSTITLYLTADNGLTTTPPTASEYQTVDTSPITTPVLSAWVPFTGYIMPEGAKIKKAYVKYWYTSDAVAIVTEADTCIWLNGGKVDSTRTSQSREDVITPGTVIGVDFTTSGIKVEEGDDIGIGVLIFATNPGGTPASVKIVLGSSAYPSSVTFTADKPVFPVV